MLTLITTQHTQTHYTTGSASAEARDDIDATDCWSLLDCGGEARAGHGAPPTLSHSSTPLHLFAITLHSTGNTRPYQLTTEQNREVGSYNFNKQKLVIIVVNSNGTKHSYCACALLHSPAETQQRQQHVLHRQHTVSTNKTGKSVLITPD